MVSMMTKTDVQEALRISQNTLDRLRQRDPFFPKPKRIPGGRRLMWSSADIERWIDSLDATGAPR